VEDAEAGGGVYVEHQYMCSECYELFNSLEDVLVHQQIHNGADGNGEQEVVSVQDVSEMEESQQYQCLECGTLLVNSDELLQHQEMHMREAGMEVEHQGKGMVGTVEFVQLLVCVCVCVCMHEIASLVRCWILWPHFFFQSG